jgi:hypothetical protein
MTPKTIVIISYLSGIIPFIAAIVVFKKANKKFYPFLFFIFLTVVVMLFFASLLLFFTYKQSKLFFDSIGAIYAIAEIMLITWIFKNLGLFDKQEKLVKPLILFFILLGVADYVYNIERPMVYFGAFIRVVGTIFGMTMINKITKSRIKNLLTNVEFVIFCGFIMYYFIDLGASIFLFDFVPVSKFFRARLHVICSACAVISEVVFMYALILIGKQGKPKTPNPKVSVSFLTELEIQNKAKILKEKQIAQQAFAQEI